MNTIKCNTRVLRSLSSSPRPQLSRPKVINVLCCCHGFRTSQSSRQEEQTETIVGGNTSKPSLTSKPLTSKDIDVIRRVLTPPKMTESCESAQSFYLANDTNLEGVRERAAQAFQASGRLIRMIGSSPADEIEATQYEKPSQLASAGQEQGPRAILAARLAARGSLMRVLKSSPTNKAVVRDRLWKSIDPFFLRDSCICPQCVNPSSTQKNFQTTDIPKDIKTIDVKILPDETLRLRWKNDIPGFAQDHEGQLPKDFFKIHGSRFSMAADRMQEELPRPWNKAEITRNLSYVDYDSYMTTDEALYAGLRNLYYHGLLLIRGVPEDEMSVERIASRIGNLRDSFYGRTWNVKSVPEAKNVAYTAQYLGLHMDLLYMANPPGFQLLHCLKNTCEGGSSLFSDSFKAARGLMDRDFETLTTAQIPYHYRNAGEHYYRRHRVFEKVGKTGRILEAVNYAPPFQAPMPPSMAGSDPRDYRGFKRAFRSFAKQTESEENLFEYRLQEGECVIFNNRRVLHGRRQFDAVHGERWLKGAYVDTDVFMSRWRVLREKSSDFDLVRARKDGKFGFVNPSLVDHDGDGILQLPVEAIEARSSQKWLRPIDNLDEAPSTAAVDLTEENGGKT